MMKIQTSRVAVATAMLVAVGMLSACTVDGDSTPTGDAVGGSWDDVVAAAKAEGEVNVYLASQEAVNEALVAGFEKEYPEITVNYVRMDSGPMEARIASEVQAGSTTADVIMLADNVQLEQNADWFRDVTELPSFADMPEGSQPATNYAITQTAPFVITYNTDEFTEAEMPKTWKELASSPVLKDSLLIDPRVASSFMAVSYFISQEEGVGTLEKYGSGSKGLSQGAAPGVQQVIAGEAAALFPNVREHTDAARAQGAHVETIIPTPTISTVNLWALPEAAQNPNAGAVFMDYAMSKAGLTATCLSGTYQPVAYDDIPNCPQEAPGTTRVLDIYPQLTEDAKAEVLAAYGLQ
jgi:iron(III) transport system substrate-binding protein